MKIDFNKITVALDLTEMDEILIRYVDYLADKLKGVEEVTFFHNIKYDFPEDVEELINELDKPLADLIRDDILEKINLNFTSKSISTQVVITQKDSSSHAIAENAKSTQSDIILVGKKVNYEGAGIMPGKLLRLTEASVLFLPETAYHNIFNILNPIDFTASSLTAYKVAEEIKNRTEANLSCLHIYNIPMNYFPYIPLEKVRSKVVNSSEKEYQSFLRKADNSGETNCVFIDSKNRSIAQSIYNYAFRKHFDFIVVGARGRTSFVGSVAEGLSNMDMHIPLLIVKKK
ncbi:universal stress protein [Membranihabitans maritimus]|uniref:universal stress protein n=1 Tax=Membranihabitans maritimus TaxID=2904244 RepID=UPI001F2EA065|nr:universal stress protein [Membranihabitans maritimus]